VLQLQYLRLKAGSGIAFAKRVELMAVAWIGVVEFVVKTAQSLTILTTTGILSNYRIGSGLLASLELIRSVVRPGIQRKW
jgi:hypothetical protein